MNIPENGFYYHYKHDPAVSFNHYAYEVTGIGHHSEREGLDDTSAFVMYRPLYETDIYKIGKHWNLRPLAMFIEDVTKDGKTFPRFQKITDESVLAELAKVRDLMYT